MALGDNYATLAELKTRLTKSLTGQDTELTQALSAASRAIEQYCGRQFNDAGSASARSYYPLSARLVHVDDFHTTSGLIVSTDTDDDGNFDTTWPGGDYQVEPFNNVRNGVTGWPFWKIRAVESAYFYDGYRPSVQVTARWGWAAVPAPIKEACLALAEETWKMKEAPFGVAGMGDFGFVRVRENPKIARMLNPYKREGVRVR